MYKLTKFDFLDTLKKHSFEIQQEFLDFIKNGNKLETPDISVFEYVGSGETLLILDKKGTRFHEGHFKILHDVISDIQGSCKVTKCNFAIMHPHSRVKLHRDVDTSHTLVDGVRYLRLRAHIGIQIPDSQVYFFINYKKVLWQEGEGFVHDIYHPHWSVNSSDFPRTILELDFMFPEVEE